MEKYRSLTRLSKDQETPPLCSMSNPTHSPRIEIGIVRRRKDASVFWLTRCLTSCRRCLGRLRRCRLMLLLLLLILFFLRSSSRLELPVLSVVHKPCQRTGHADDQQAFKDVCVEVFCEVIAAVEQRVADGRFHVIIRFAVLVIRGVFVEEGGKPLAPRRLDFRFFAEQLTRG